MTRAGWPGNVAKDRVIKILAGVDRRITVFDHGAGTGSHWPDILRQSPHIHLIAFEPGPNSVKLKQRLVGLDAEVVSTPGGFQTDYVVSFSVLEHVYDRRAYMSAARDILKPGGTFFLNYDDGHFRNKIDLARPASAPLREHLAGIFSPIFPKIGLLNHYQTRVKRSEADALIRACNFRMVSQRYENIPSMKNLFKSVPLERTTEFMDMWLRFEDELNERFSIDGPMAMSDVNMLWTELGTRTLELV